MKSLSRRKVLMLGGAAAAAPLVASAAEACPIFGSRRSAGPRGRAFDYENMPCTLRVTKSAAGTNVHKPKHVIMIGETPYEESDDPQPIIAKVVTGTLRSTCLLPWAEHIMLETDSRKNSQPLNGFTFETRCRAEATGETNVERVIVRVLVTAKYRGDEDGRPGTCLIMCDSTEYIVQQGDCIMCHGIQRCCGMV